METAVVSDCPRKAAYLTPLIMTEHASTLDKMAANWPLLVWRRYLPERIRVAGSCACSWPATTWWAWTARRWPTSLTTS